MWIKAKRAVVQESVMHVCIRAQMYMIYVGAYYLQKNVWCRVVTGAGKCICHIQSQDSVESFIYINRDRWFFLK